MRFEAITRKSGLLAIILAAILVTGALVRTSFAPYSIELIEHPYSERVISKIMAGMLFVVGGIITGRLFISCGLSKNYCTLPIPIYCILACCIALSPNMLTTAVAAALFPLSLLLITNAAKRGNDINLLFLGAILLGVLPLASPQCVLLGLIIFIAIPFFAISFRGVITMVVGWALPIFAASYIMWYSGESITILVENMWQVIATSRDVVLTQIPYGAIILVATIIIVFIWGWVTLVLRRQEAFILARVRRQLWFFAIVAILSLTLLLLPSYTLSPLAIAATPLAILLSFILSETPTNSSTIAYWVLLAITVVHLFIE